MFTGTMYICVHTYLYTHLVVSHLFLGQGCSYRGGQGGAIGAMWGPSWTHKPVKSIGERIKTSLETP